MYALRPPEEPRRRADQIGVALQRDAALRLGVLQLLDSGEVPIDQHRVGQRPQVLSRLQLRGMWWQEQQVDMLGYAHLGAGMPARAVEHEHDLFGRTGVDPESECFQLQRQELDAPMRTVVARCHTVHPEDGCTKPMT